MDQPTAQEENERYVQELVRARRIRQWLGPRRRLVVFVAVLTELYVLGIALVGNVLTDRQGLHLGRVWWLAAIPGWFLFMALVFGVYRLAPRLRRWEAARAALRSGDSVAILRLAEGLAGPQLARMPGADALILHNRARMQICFGEVAAARHSLAAVDWEARAPAVQALGVADEAALKLLCTGDVAGGLALARRALEMGSIRKSATRIRARRDWRVALVGLGEVLAGEATGETLAGLRRLARRANDLAARVLATRALYLAAWRAGDTGRAEALRRRLERDAPHCAPLLAGPEGPPPGAEWARDPGEPSRALLPSTWKGPRPIEPPAPPRAAWRQAPLAVRLAVVALLTAFFVYAMRFLR